MACFHRDADGQVVPCLLGALCLNPSFHFPTVEAAEVHHLTLDTLTAA